MIDAFFNDLQEIANEGAVVVVKLDGLRKTDGDPKMFSLVISGGRLKDDDFFRKDSADFVSLLEDGIGFYRSKF